jgi:hypothetical protein
MMKNWMITGVIAAVLLIFAGAVSCSRRGTDPVLPPFDREEISAELLWERMVEETDYTEYHFWPGHEGISPGQAPHGVFHKVYINKLIYDALPLEDREVPDGGIIIKENYSADEEPTGLTVMAKVDGFHPGGGDWFWAAYTMEGKVNIAGQVDGCIGCHEGMRDNDYVIVYPLDREVDK